MTSRDPWVQAASDYALFNVGPLSENFPDIPPMPKRSKFITREVTWLLRRSLEGMPPPGMPLMNVPRELVAALCSDGTRDGETARLAVRRALDPLFETGTTDLEEVRRRLIGIT